MIRVLLADDHQVLRMGLRLLLNQAFDIEVVAEAENGREALDLANRLRPDVAVLDYDLPGLDGAQVAGEIQQRGLPIRVLALSSFTDIRYVRNMLNAGAVGYLVKNEAPRVIVQAVRGVQNESWFSSSISSHVIKLMKDKRAEAEEAEVLTPREQEALDLLAQGLKNKEMANSLQISPRTVAYHIENVLNKLGVNNRTQAVVVAIKRGLVKV